MKLNKSKNKGKVHPSPSSSLSTANDTVSTLNNLLPAAILTLISILSLPDKEVLAYMITHSLSSSTTSSSFPTSLNNKNGKKPCSKKNTTSAGGSKTSAHKIPTFDCGCFECYTSYWTRWDSSPNRELIHQAIEAFEEHLTTCEQQKNNSSPSKSSTSRRKVKRGSYGSAPASPQPSFAVKQEKKEDSPEILEVGPLENGESFLGSVESPVRDDGEVGDCGVQQGSNGKQGLQQQQQQHKGLARKVLPDVIGLFNSRLWNLWGPNV